MDSLKNAMMWKFHFLHFVFLKILWHRPENFSEKRLNLKSYGTYWDHFIDSTSETRGFCRQKNWTEKFSPLWFFRRNNIKVGNFYWLCGTSQIEYLTELSQSPVNCLKEKKHLYITYFVQWTVQSREKNLSSKIFAKTRFRWKNQIFGHILSSKLTHLWPLIVQPFQDLRFLNCTCQIDSKSRLHCSE